MQILDLEIFKQKDEVKIIQLEVGSGIGSPK